MTAAPRLGLLGPWPPPYGGVAVHVFRLRELLVESGFEPHVLSFDASVPSHDQGMHRLQGGMLRWPLSLATLARVVGRNGILHNHSVLTSYPERQVLEPLLFVVKQRRIKWIETVHDRTITVRYQEFSAGERSLFRRAMTNAERVIAVGDEIQAFLTDAGVSETKLVVGQPILPARLAGEQIPASLGRFFTSHSPVWITIGAFTPLYDFATIARAFRRYAHTSGSAGLVIVSSSFARDRSYESDVRSALGDVSDRVVFLEDVDPHEIEALLRESTVLIRGPQYESFGLSRVEALLAGIPVVATNTGQTRFMTLYSYGDPDSLLAAIGESSRTESTTLRAAAAYYSRMASESFERLLEVYEDLGAVRQLPTTEQ